jgi:hypothetical protein
VQGNVLMACRDPSTGGPRAAAWKDCATRRPEAKIGELLNLTDSRLPDLTRSHPARLARSHVGGRRARTGPATGRCVRVGCYTARTPRRGSPDRGRDRAAGRGGSHDRRRDGGSVSDTNGNGSPMLEPRPRGVAMRPSHRGRGGRAASDRMLASTFVDTWRTAAPERRGSRSRGTERGSRRTVLRSMTGGD